MDGSNAKDKIDRALKSAKQFALFGGASMVFGVAISTVSILYVSYENYRLYQKFAYCPEKKGRPGEKVGDACFRNLKTSGEVSVFLSSTNFYLEKGVEAFKNEDYPKAIKLFEQAIDGDPTDPVSKIFLNNAKARQRGNPLRLALVTSIDYYETAAREVLRGVADAQEQFNESQEKQAPLIEIVIASDENEREAAKKVAQGLVDDPSILGIIGHHASESTTAAQKIYEKENIAVISPTSTSSQLSGSSQLKREKFFRTVGGNKKSAEKYADYIRKLLGLDKIVVFYKKGSEYSENLKDDFKEYFSKEGGKTLADIDISSDSFEIETEINKAVNTYKTKAILVISNVKTDSIVIAVNRKNANLPPNQKLKLLGSMALSEEDALKRGGEAVEGMILVKPCSASQSKYMKDASKRWQNQQQEVDWRTLTSYDATQAFAKALSSSKTQTREDILRQLQSPSFSLSNEETSGFGLKWDLSDRSNANRKYCVFQIKDGKFVDIKPKNIPVKRR
jgi:ABC-type branched-subunit amino acid transport system substrate-binding protein